MKPRLPVVFRSSTFKGRFPEDFFQYALGYVIDYLAERNKDCQIFDDSLSPGELSYTLTRLGLNRMQARTCMRIFMGRGWLFLCRENGKYYLNNVISEGIV
jgi:hypothetical protein